MGLRDKGKVNLIIREGMGMAIRRKNKSMQYNQMDSTGKECMCGRVEHMVREGKL